MLNYIWLFLIIIGILTAAGRDIYDDLQNKYQNGVPFPIEANMDGPHSAGNIYHLNCTISQADFQKHFHLASSQNLQPEIIFPSTLTLTGESQGTVVLLIDDKSPEVLQTISSSQGGKNTLAGSCRITFNDSLKRASIRVQFEPVHFVWLKKITSAAFDAAGTAVQIALGLIGIMALWLGVMKVAEESGIIKIMVRIVRPVTRRLFPDIPGDHPAIGAIMMNIAANMLGLGNAATPFGLKAMEELNRLNKHAGQATNAMVTFLALNTSCITLIPATAIAIRAAAGSSQPAIIIGPTLLASLTATICGVVISKLLQRLPLFAITKERNAS